MSLLNQVLNSLPRQIHLVCTSTTYRVQCGVTFTLSLAETTSHLQPNELLPNELLPNELLPNELLLSAHSTPMNITHSLVNNSITLSLCDTRTKHSVSCFVLHSNGVLVA